MRARLVRVVSMVLLRVRVQQYQVNQEHSWQKY